MNNTPDNDRHERALEKAARAGDEIPGMSCFGSVGDRDKAVVAAIISAYLAEMDIEVTPTECEWYPMEFAPVGVRVELGRWSNYGGKLQWETTDGVAFKKAFFGLRKEATYCAGEYSHWRHFPRPPHHFNQEGK